VPPNVGIVVSGPANNSSARHILEVNEGMLAELPEETFRGKLMYELPVHNIDLLMTACIEINNMTDAFVNVIFMEIVDTVRSKHPTLRK